LDVDQAQSNLSQTQALIPRFEIDLRRATNRLCILLGMPPVDLQARLGAGAIPTAPPDVAVGIPAELLTRRPEVRRAEREAAAQCARIGVAVSELYPHIAVSGTVGFSAENFKDLLKDRSLQGSVGPSFQWNVLNYGRLVNNIRLQDARFQELVLSYQNTVLRANQEVEDGLIRFLKSQERSRDLAQSVEAAERAVRVALVQYRGGLVDFNRVALLEQNLVVQQDLLAQAQGDIAIGLVEVYKSLGGGWQIRLGPGPGPNIPFEELPPVRPAEGAVPGNIPPVVPGDIPPPLPGPVAPIVPKP
jgi:outer membrane protein TolC